MKSFFRSWAAAFAGLIMIFAVAIGFTSVPADAAAPSRSVSGKLSCSYTAHGWSCHGGVKSAHVYKRQLPSFVFDKKHKWVTVVPARGTALEGAKAKASYSGGYVRRFDPQPQTRIKLHLTRHGKKLHLNKLTFTGRVATYGIG